jgi:hypothetical protein
MFVIAASSSLLLPAHIISFATTSTSLAPDPFSESSTERIEEIEAACSNS